MNNLSIEELKSLREAYYGMQYEKIVAVFDELISIRELKGDQVPFRYMAEWPSQSGGMEYDYSEVRSEMDEVAAEHDGSVIELFTAPQKPVVLPVADHETEDGYKYYREETVKAAIEAAGDQVPVAYITSDGKMLIFADSPNMLPEDKSSLTPLFKRDKKTGSNDDCLSCDRHYVDGMKAGWNFHEGGDNQGFIDSIDRVQKDMREARKEQVKNDA